MNPLAAVSGLWPCWLWGVVDLALLPGRRALRAMPRSRAWHNTARLLIVWPSCS